MDFPRDNLTRSVPFTLERAASGEGDGLTLEGYGAVFDTTPCSGRCRSVRST